jgi:hypothetical protein
MDPRVKYEDTLSERKKEKISNTNEAGVGIVGPLFRHFFPAGMHNIIW